MAPTNFNSDKLAPSYITGVSNINLWCTGNNYVYNVSTRNRNKEKRQEEKTENNK